VSWAPLTSRIDTKSDSEPARATPRASQRGEEGGGDAARNGADEVEVGGAGERAGDGGGAVEGGDVAFEVPVGLGLDRVLPADDEDLVALRDEVLDDRGREVPDG
jgi:hypothetical protein